MQKVVFLINEQIEKKAEELGRPITDSEIARAIGVTPMSITNYRRGTHEPKVGYAYRLAKYFNCSIDDLVEEEVDSCRAA